MYGGEYCEFIPCCEVKPLRIESFYFQLFKTRKSHIIQQMLPGELLSIPGFLRFPVT